MPRTAGDVSGWLTGFSLERNMIFMLLFIGLTVGIVSGGVHDGIERWSSRLMPVLIVTLVLLVIYVLTLDGAMQGLEVYLLPDFQAALQPKLACMSTLVFTPEQSRSLPIVYRSESLFFNRQKHLVIKETLESQNTSTSP